VTQKRQRKIENMVRRWRSKSYQKALQDTAATLQMLVRVEAADHRGVVRCVCCGRAKIWNDGMEGSHFIPRNYTATMLCELNVEPSCTHCNHFLAGNLPGFAEWLGPQKVAKLEELKGHRKYTLEELAEMRQGWMERTTEAKKRIGA